MSAASVSVSVPRSTPTTPFPSPRDTTPAPPSEVDFARQALRWPPKQSANLGEVSAQPVQSDADLPDAPSSHDEWSSSFTDALNHPPVQEGLDGMVRVLKLHTTRLTECVRSHPDQQPTQNQINDLSGDVMPALEDWFKKLSSAGNEHVQSLQDAVTALNAACGSELVGQGWVESRLASARQRLSAPAEVPMARPVATPVEPEPPIASSPGLSAADRLDAWLDIYREECSHQLADAMEQVVSVIQRQLRSARGGLAGSVLNVRLGEQTSTLLDDMHLTALAAAVKLASGAEVRFQRNGL